MVRNIDDELEPCNENNEFVDVLVDTVSEFKRFLVDSIVFNVSGRLRSLLLPLVPDMCMYNNRVVLVFCLCKVSS